MRPAKVWGGLLAGALLAATADGARDGQAAARAAAALDGATADPTRVRVESGLLAGMERDGVLVFAGVPYAAPPVGDLRWQPPRPPVAWTGERAATAAGPDCMQRSVPNPFETNFDGGPPSEDCLRLQVFAPKAAHAAPVMVWIHGGSNVIGGSARTVYDGTAFARDGVIMVAINYRLGAFGFFAHPALTRAAAPGESLANYALMDQIAALRWVQRNIAAFGGDPARVTVFGESAGGGAVIDLLVAPSARGLFARAIAESPAGGWEPLNTMADAEKLGERIAKQAGLADPAPAGAVSPAALRALPAERILAAQIGMYTPALDGRLLPANPVDAFLAGSQAHVPLVLGTNTDEASLVPHPAVLVQEASNALLAAYAAADPKHTGDTADDTTLGAALFGDRFFTAPERFYARQAAAAGSSAWLYVFSYVRTSQRSQVRGAAHGSEIPFVFASWDKIAPRRAAFLPQEDRAMTALVHAAWVAFARTGSPDVSGLPAWPLYTARRDELLDLGTTVTVKQHYRRAQLDAQEHASAFLLHRQPPAP